jgi:alkylation response protein AidB-like acyl-CoA dehydrogenase
MSQTYDVSFRPPIRSLALALRAAGYAAFLTENATDLDEETSIAVLEAAGSFLANEFAPLNRRGDIDGARIDAEGVHPTLGFSEAYQAFANNGWNALAADPRWGGEGLPKALEFAVFEMAQAANASLAICPMLTQGAIEALVQHGTPRQQALVLPRLISGAWTGTMNLTEPQAGTDLAAVVTRADPDAQGGYRLNGQKIFISWGDHDMTENICHLVLARLPNSPPGISGISLFLATKFEVGADGAPGARNGIYCSSIEKKLGIHGSPTCVMMLEDAHAELVGDIGKGVAQMFTMMNSARLHVGIQGVGLAERAYQQALSYALGRKQGRTILGSSGLIIDHPDVRRMLGLMRAKTDAARGLCLTTAVLADRAAHGDKAAKRRSELLTPIAKAWSTDVGVEVASLALQVQGGMGFIEETGAAQYYRDARIGPIYEGTNGIQALDLIGRKLAGDGGEAMMSLIDDMVAEGPLALQPSVEALRSATAWLLSHPGADALAGATAYLKLAGDVVGGFMLWRQVQAAGIASEWDRSRMSIFNLYVSQVLSGAAGQAQAVTAGAADLGPWTYAIN